jgi:hypothetical protein
VDTYGRLTIATATLIERQAPYQLLVELARGKVNQARCQLADWEASGLIVTPELAEKMLLTNRTFARTVSVPESAGSQAAPTLAAAVDASEALVQAYINQVFQARHQRHGKLDTSWGCRLGPELPSPEQTRQLRQTFKSVRILFSWSDVEPEESVHNWEPYDAVLRWAKDNQFDVTAGPLIDFSRGRLPQWLWLWEKDPQRLAGFLAGYVETVVRRYCQDIQIWQVTAASNWASILSLEEDELLWLTLRLLEVARQVDGNLQLVVGIAQPWGEYLASDDRAHSPFVFADTLLRSGPNLAALDLEFISGLWPRGSYPRDLLEASRLLDLYAILGLPLRVTLGCPSGLQPDPQADPVYQVQSLGKDTEWSPETQAAWAKRYGSLILCKPFVHAIDWVHFTDAAPHQFANCGLLDAQQKPKPVLAQLQTLRREHLDT